MKIAQVCPLYNPVPPKGYGGTERVVGDLSDALVARGHAVTLFAADGSLTDAMLAPQGPAVSTVPDAPPSLQSAMECVMLDRVAAMADRFDIIHCHTEFAHALALRAFHHKLFTTIHWRTDEQDRQAYFRHFRSFQVVAISCTQAQDIPACNLAGIVHHGLSPLRYSLGTGRRGDLVFIGRMTDQKRPDRAIRLARASGLRLKLAGTIDAGNPMYFDRFVAPYLGDGIEYVGSVGDAEKQQLLGDAAAVLFPVDWQEPFGLVMIEAMACGTPVIGWNNGSVPEVLEEGITGYVVDNEKQALRAIGEAVRLPRPLIRERFENRFTSHRMACDYEAIYAAASVGTVRGDNGPPRRHDGAGDRSRAGLAGPTKPV